MKASTEIARRYRLLFSLPSLKTIIIEITLVSILLGLILGSIENNIIHRVTHILLPFYMLCFFISSILSAILSKLILKPETLTIRRLLGLSLLSMITSGIIQITVITILLLINKIEIYRLSLILSFGLMLFLRFMVLGTLEKRGLIRTTISSLTQPLFTILTYPYPYLIGPQKTIRLLTELAYVAGLFSINSWCLLASINLRTERKTQMRGIELFRAFMKNWLTGDKKPLEEIFKKYAITKKMKIWCILFSAENGAVNSAMIIPQIHYGPFRNVGSSQLPSMIIKELKLQNIEAVVLHGASSHEENLASEEDCREIINSIINTIKECKTTEETLSPIAVSREGAATAYCIILGDKALVILSRAPKTTEDLPKWVEEKILQICRQNGLKDACIIDAHNSIIDEEEITHKDYEELINAAKKAIIKAVNAGKYNFKLGIINQEINEYSEEHGIGKGGLSTLIIEVNGKDFIFSVFDGNNMIPEFREKILEKLHSLGFNNVELLTTDTHSVNALEPGRRGYHPIGEKTDYNILINHIIKQIRKHARYAIKINEVNVKVLGQEFIQKIAQVINISINTLKKMFALTHVIAIFLTILPYILS